MMHFAVPLLFSPTTADAPASANCLVDEAART
jgi:hypothetical protein